MAQFAMIRCSGKDNTKLVEGGGISLIACYLLVCIDMAPL